jgi:hypothetical protein
MPSALTEKRDIDGLGMIFRRLMDMAEIVPMMAAQRINKQASQIGPF